MNDRELADLYESGLSLSQVSEKTGATIGRVRNALSRLNIKPRARNCGIGKKPNHSRRLENLKANMQAVYMETAIAYKESKSLADAASTLGIRSDTVRLRLKNAGIKRRPRGSGKGAENHQYKGGKRNRKDGYLELRGSRARPLEHRAVAEKALGRPLKRNEVVHHINKDKSDNRNCNLLVCTNEYHLALHARMKNHPDWQ